MGSWKGLVNNYRDFSLYILLAAIMNFVCLVTGSGLLMGIVYPLLGLIGFNMVLFFYRGIWLEIIWGVATCANVGCGVDCPCVYIRLYIPTSDAGLP